jgi:signal transduction histidine kinase
MRPHGIGNLGLVFGWILAAAIVALFGIHRVSFAQQSAVNEPVVPPALTTALQVKHLTSEEARSNRAVRLRAIVLYYNQQDFVDLIVHDDTAGIYLADTRKKQFHTRPGDVVEVTGVTGAGDYAPVVRVSALRVVGSAPLPAPREVSYERLVSGVEDAEWVQVRGIIRNVTPSRMTPPGALQVDLMTSGGRLNARVQNYDPGRVAALVDSEVVITGVCTPVFNKRRQLLDMRLSVPTVGHIETVHPAPLDPFDGPTRTINQLRQYEPKSNFGHRVKVRGVVMLREKDRSLFVRDDTQGVRVATAHGPSVAVGDEVEVVGFAAQGGYSPMLEDATYRRTGATRTVPPMTVTLAQARGGEHDCDLVQLEGELLEWIPNPAEHILLLRQGDVVFRAYLPRVDRAFGALPLQSRVRATGICVTELGPQRRPQSFRLLLRSPADLQVLRSPPWWNPRRLAWAMGALSLLVFGSSCWVVLLRRQVAAQTALIGTKIHQEAILEERHRMAREIHDTLVQSFAAISLQLEALRDKLGLGDPARVARHLDLAHRLARESMADARRSIWALHNTTAAPNLAASLAASCKSIIAGTGIENSIAIEGELPRLSPEIENNLVYISREAVINSVKHGAPRRITLTLRREPRALLIIVHDDGCGFESLPRSGRLDQGGFGMVSMHERAEQICADLQIESRCGAGTTVCVTVPLHGA